jgi:hypothetical protein
MVAGHAPTSVSADRPMPPVAPLAVASMASVIASGIYIASHVPSVPPLAPAVGLLVLSALFLGAALFLLRRVGPFSWTTFRTIVQWTLVAYAVIAGMLEYVFVVDGTRGGSLLVVTASLLLFAVDVPLILAFSVARYQTPD